MLEFVEGNCKNYRTPLEFLGVNWGSKFEIFGMDFVMAWREFILGMAWREFFWHGVNFSEMD